MSRAARMAPEGRASGTWRSPTGRRSSPTRARITTRRSRSTRAEIAPRSPGAPARGRAADHRRVPDPDGLARRQARGDAGARLHGPEPGHPMTDIEDRHGVHRLLHQRPDRGPARRRQGDRGPPVKDGVRAMIVPGSGLVQGAGRGRRARANLHRGRLRLARWPGCSMCLGMNPDQLSPASAAPRPRTATSRAGRAAAGAPTW
jgi:hypothetical protein